MFRIQAQPGVELSSSFFTLMVTTVSPLSILQHVLHESGQLLFLLQARGRLSQRFPRAETPRHAKTNCSNDCVKVNAETVQQLEAEQSETILGTICPC